MAIGDQNDIFNRLKDNLVRWFGTDPTPNLDALLQGTAETDAYIESLIDYGNLQSRIKTSTDFYLDLTSIDFFGDKLPRHVNESDDSFRNRILAELLIEKATRNGMTIGLTNLTGRVPIIWEPELVSDNMALNVPLFGYNVPTGGFGTFAIYQAWIYVFRPQPLGANNVAGFNVTNTGFNVVDSAVGNFYSNNSLITVLVSDADILALIEATKTFGTLMHVTIFD